MVQKILYFFGGSPLSQNRDADAIVGAGRVGRGLMKGRGVLLGQTTAIVFVEESQGVTMIEIHHRGMGEMRVMVIFLKVKPMLGVDFGNVVARTSHANVRLRC